MRSALKNRPGCLRVIIWLVVGGGLLFVFRNELYFIRSLVLTALLGQPASGFPPLGDALRTGLFMALNVVIAFCLAGGVLYWIAGAVHPIQSKQQIYNLLGRIVSYIFGSASPCSWFVKAKGKTMSF